MNLARIRGTIWATRSYPGTEGMSFRIVEPIDRSGRVTGAPFAAADPLGAGPGEIVTYVTAYEAVVAHEVELVPLDATLTAIVERVDRDDPAAGPVGSFRPDDLAGEEGSS